VRGTLLFRRPAVAGCMPARTTFRSPATPACSTRPCPSSTAHHPRGAQKTPTTARHQRQDRQRVRALCPLDHSSRNSAHGLPLMALATGTTA
jgi:hypothetical protein